MRKILLLLAVVLTNMVMLHAQVLILNPAYQQLNFNASDNSSEAISSIFNNSSSQRTLRWVVTILNQPNGWQVQVCDKSQCYAPGDLSEAFALDADSMSYMRFSIYPYGVAGSGQFKMVIYDVNDSANANVTMSIDATADPTGISMATNVSFSLYPNPAKSILYLNLDPGKHITSIDIHNIVGEKIKTINIERGLKSVVIPVADLKKGIYFLRVISNGEELATMTFSKD